MVKRTEMKAVMTTNAQAPNMIDIARPSVNGMNSIVRRLHDVLPSTDHSILEHEMQL